MVTDLKSDASLPVGALSSRRISGNMLHTFEPIPSQFGGWSASKMKSRVAEKGKHSENQGVI